MMGTSYPLNAGLEDAVPRICIQQDISDSAAFQDIRQWHAEFLLPSTNQPVDLTHISYSPDGSKIAGAATICGELRGTPLTRLVVIDIENGRMDFFGQRSGSDKRPQWSPDGENIAFLSETSSCNQLHLLDVTTGLVRPTSSIAGSVEQMSWSPSGKQLLLVIAGIGADKSGVEGATALVTQVVEHDPDLAWKPQIEFAAPLTAYRDIWVYDCASGSYKRILHSKASWNFWHAVWISQESLIAVCSLSPGESDWYHPYICKVDMSTQTVTALHHGCAPIECLKASPSGKSVAFITGIASDRPVIYGDICVLSVHDSSISTLDTGGVSIGFLDWCGDEEIVATGFCNQAEVILRIELGGQDLTRLWMSEQFSIGDYHIPAFSCHGERRELSIAFLRSGWLSRPTLCELSHKGMKEIRVFSSASLEDDLRNLGTCQRLNWKAPDGLDVFGFFLEPLTAPPHRTILFIHGGPVTMWRPRYLGQNTRLLIVQAFLRAGFAVFMPNPRGSSGRGQEFARRVVGDMCGADTFDYLSGLDALTENGRVDVDRIGVHGVSYGGLMSCWLVTQDQRFRAAVPVAPVSDFVSAQYTSNIGRFFEDFMRDEPHDTAGKYFTRSPLHHAHNACTPVLLVCGALDKSTPPTQALMFQRALSRREKRSVLVTYPQEGHGVKQMPAIFDMMTRTVEWFKFFV